MMILAIAASTMVIVALVVLPIEFHLYRKYQAKRDKEGTRQISAVETREAPMAP